MVEIHSKAEKPTSLISAKKEEEIISEDDRNRYLLLMKYTSSGEKRIIGGEGRCIVSNHLSELFINTISELEQRYREKVIREKTESKISFNMNELEETFEKGEKRKKRI